MYRAEVWYTHLHKTTNTSKTKGSVSVTNKLCSTQHKVAKTITGALNTTAGNILDAHAYILPTELLFNKLLYKAMLHLCSLLPEHPLHQLIHSATHQKIRRHLSPIHHIIKFACAKPTEIETITPI
jgi:hypothetical protein